MKKNKKKDKKIREKCKCDKNPAKAPHTCPFKTEIYNDNSLCDCCDECEKECCWDI